MLRMDAWTRLLTSKRDGQLLIPILALCGDQNGEPLPGLTPEDEDRIMEEATEFVPPMALQSPPMALTGWRRQQMDCFRNSVADPEEAMKPSDLAML
jgi:hypothetical protein